MRRSRVWNRGLWVYDLYDYPYDMIRKMTRVVVCRGVNKEVTGSSRIRRDREKSKEDKEQE